MVLNTEVILLTLFFLHLVNGLRVTNLDVPRYIMVGDAATLKCHFKLEGEKLYSINWWKDDRQFYQYIPKNDPEKVIYKIPGVTVNEKNSGVYSVELSNVQERTKGEYRCEVVGEAPAFPTTIRRANLSIIDPPDGPPVIRGQKQIYHPGEIVHLNCTTYWSRPAPHIMWAVLKAQRSFALSSTSHARSKSSSSSAYSSSSSPLVGNSPLPSTSSLLPLYSPTSSLSPSKQASVSPLLSTPSSGPPTIEVVPIGKQAASVNPFLFKPLQNSHHIQRRDTLLTEDSHNYTKVESQYLVNYPLQTVTEEGKPSITSVTLGIKFPANLLPSGERQLTLR